MTLVVDSEMPSNAGVSVVGSGTNLSFNFTNTAGTVVYLIGGFGCPGGSTPPALTATFGGVSMTAVVTALTSGGTTGGKIAIFRLLLPGTGLQPVVLTYGGVTSGVDEIYSGCISFTGNHATTPEAQSSSSNSGGGSSANPAQSLSGVAAGNITICALGGGSSITAQTQTLSWSDNVDVNTSMGNGRVSRSASSGAVSHGFTMASDSWAAGIVEVASAAAGPLPYGYDQERKAGQAVKRAAYFMLGDKWERHGKTLLIPPRRVLVGA